MQLTSQCFSSHLFTWALKVTASPSPVAEGLSRIQRGHKYEKLPVGLARQGSLVVHLWNKLLIKVLKPPVWCWVACDMWGCSFNADSSAYQFLQTWSVFLLPHLHWSLCSCNVIQKIRNPAPADLHVTGCLRGVHSPSCILTPSAAKSTWIWWQEMTPLAVMREIPQIQDWTHQPLFASVGPPNVALTLLSRGRNSTAASLNKSKDIH